MSIRGESLLCCIEALTCLRLHWQHQTQVAMSCPLPTASPVCPGQQMHQHLSTDESLLHHLTFQTFCATHVQSGFQALLSNTLTRRKEFHLPKIRSLPAYVR